MRSPDAFTLRRCQILLASDRGENAYQIARSLGCNPQTVRNAIHAFNQKGLPQALLQGSKRPRTVQRAFDPQQAETLRELLHHKPRKFGKGTSVWTLDLAAEVSFEEGLTEECITAETIRATPLADLDVQLAVRETVQVPLARPDAQPFGRGLRQQRVGGPGEERHLHVVRTP